MSDDLRNQLLEGDLIVPVAEGDDLVCAAQTAAQTQDRVTARIEELGRGLYHVHVPAPRAVQARVDELVDQDWDHARSTLEEAALDLAGLPHDIQQELQASVSRFRAGMSWTRRLREALFASLTALPPVVGVTYALLTANPALGTGIWIELEGLFGLNDLWALVAIPASAGLTEQDRRQLELMIAPVFRAWLSRRTAAICDIYREVVFAPISEALASMPGTDDPRLTTLSEAIARLSGDLA